MANNNNNISLLDNSYIEWLFIFQLACFFCDMGHPEITNNQLKDLILDTDYHEDMIEKLDRIENKLDNILDILNKK